MSAEGATVPALDRRARAQDFIPVVADDTDVDRAADDGRQRFVFRAGVQDIEPSIGEIADARREAEAQEAAKAEHMVDGAGGVGVMLANVERAFMMQTGRREYAPPRWRWRR